MRNICGFTLTGSMPEWRFVDGDPGVRTWKVLQHMLNESYANSGKLLKK